MPKSGFKSITIPENVYDRLEADYQKQKMDLKFEGINSFSAYIVAKRLKR